MGLLKSLFGGNNNEMKKNNSVQTDYHVVLPTKQSKSEVQDMILLSLAENYRVDETNYPAYLRTKYGIGFPNEKLRELEQMGYVRPASASESLSHLKASELKEIAAKFGIKGSGKKDELCTRIINNVQEEELTGKVTARYWKITESGKAVLDENPYIAFYLEKHPYSLEEIGLDINTYAKLFKNKTDGRVRDVLWGEFNRRSLDCFKKMHNGEFREYCDLLRVMALFLEEENRHKDALAMYMRYLHYRANFDASLAAINYYSLMKKVKESADILFSNAEIYPFIAKEIIDMSNGCQFDSKQLEAFMQEALSKEKDTGLFTPEELTQFIMCGLNGDQEGQKKMCKKAMSMATKKIKK